MIIIFLECMKMLLKTQGSDKFVSHIHYADIHFFHDLPYQEASKLLHSIFPYIISKTFKKMIRDYLGGRSIFIRSSSH